jgi:hypothetical protein
MKSSERVVGLLKPTTVGRAALLATITGTGVILRQTIDLAPIRNSTNFPFDLILPALFGFYVPALAWLAFFWTMYRERTGATSSLSSPAAAWIALALGVVLPLLYVSIPQVFHFISVTPYGEVRLVLSFATAGVWIIFLCLYALHPNDRRIPKVAQGLALLTGLEFADVIYEIATRTHFETWWNYPWARTFWQIVTIAIRILASASRLLFVWTVWRSQGPSEARVQPFDGIA